MRARLWIAAVTIGALAVPAGRLAAGSVAAGAVAKVKVSAGQVFLVRGGAKSATRVGQPLVEHDVLTTGGNGSVGITFTDNTSMSSGPNSHIAIDSYAFEP